ncbi:MAG: Na/Pi cotransporter family protein, partial [Lachnospiraceae bacterium]|nr:Na/Pi cotransporter family protein [Lachnospiraceae bacterium]
MVKEEDIKPFAGKIREESTRMTKLVEDIIDLTKLDNGGIEMKWEDCDLYRIAENAVNILESAEELVQKGIVFSDQAQKEYNLISDAVEDILDLSHTAFKDTDLKAARKTEPLEQIVDELKETLRTRHILRLQKGECSVDAGFVWSDLLTNLERVADHCSNISGCVLDTAGHTMNIHQNQR